MAERTCLNCVYVCCEPGVWLRCLAAGEPLVPRCANHSRWPGQLREVPGTPCRNFRPKPAEPAGDIKRIPLGRGQYAYVDAADYEWLSRWNWQLFGKGYAVRCEKGKTIFMHREIMQAPAGMVVDHIDGNPRNNYRSNLRVCTPAENISNTAKRAGASSRFKGVFLLRKTGKWCAKIQFEGRSIWLGTFDDEVEAARAYDRKAVEIFGRFARPNFPEDWPAKRRQEVHAQWLKAHGGRDGESLKTRRTRQPNVGRRRATASRMPSRKGRKPARTRKAG